jgi:hypothetical protein
VTDFNLPDKDDAPWLDCMDGFQNLEDTNKRTDTITPPFELIKQWSEESPMECSAESWAYELFIVHHAAQWGYKQAVKELETVLKEIVDTPCNNSMTTKINGDKLFVIDHHPAIPTSDQLKKWEDKWFDEEEHPDVLLIQAFQAGADQELEACCQWLANALSEDPQEVSQEIRAARRPKPPTLKEQALSELEILRIDANAHGLGFDAPAIRRALEQLDD